MVIPLYDSDPLEGKSTPYVTYGLMAANISIGAALILASQATREALLDLFALEPAFELRNTLEVSMFPRDLALITSMFLHADWWHLAGNMLFLWIVGDNVEDAVGHVRFALLYFASGILGGVAYIASAPSSTALLFGASGAIAGVMVAYAMLRPCAKIEVWVEIIPVAFPAYIAIACWMLAQVVHLLTGGVGETAYWAHLGGGLTGMFFTFLARPPGLRLFDCKPPVRVSRSD
jgi:membrane associated rhomboid family serine protease